MQPGREEDEESGEESEAESETEEAQVCWAAIISFCPVIIEIVMEFSGAAAEAVCTWAVAAEPIDSSLPALTLRPLCTMAPWP